MLSGTQETFEALSRSFKPRVYLRILGIFIYTNFYPFIKKIFYNFS